MSKKPGFSAINVSVEFMRAVYQLAIPIMHIVDEYFLCPDYHANWIILILKSNTHAYIDVTEGEGEWD